MPAPLRVLMMSQYPFEESDHTLGGIMQTTYQLVNGFIELDSPDLDLRVLSLNETCRKLETRKYGRVTVYHLPKSTSALGFIFSEPFRLLFRFILLLIRFRPQVLHAQGNVSFIMLSLLFGKRSVQTVHGIFRNEQKAIPKEQQSSSLRIRFFLREALESVYLRAIRTIIVTSNQLVALAQSAGGFPKRIVWIDNSVDKGFFITRDAASEATKGSVTLLFAGVITPRKGLHILLAAFARLAAQKPGVSLRIVGIRHAAPEYVEALETQYRALIEGGRVFFTGGITQQAIIEEYRRADAYVLATLGDTAPVAISQAMCASLPVLSTRIGGIPDMVEDGRTGLIVAPGDVDALFSALDKLTGDTAMMRAMGRAGYERGKVRYHPVSSATKTYELYREIAGS